MGGGMARCLLAGGYEVVGYDLAEPAMKAFADAGGCRAQSVRHVADQAEIVFASLPTIEASRKVVSDVSGNAIRIFIETSTVGPSEAREMAKALEQSGIRYLDAPVSGGAAAANAGTLTTIISGDVEAVAEVKPIYAKMASNIVDGGDEPGRGQLFKVINNFIVMNSVAVVCEAIAVGVRAGASEDQLLEVINLSTGRNFATKTFFPGVIMPRTSDLPFDMILKDVKLFSSLADKQGSPSNAANQVRDEWEAASNKGLTVLQWYEMLLKR